MPKHRLILVSLAAAAVAALSGCVVAPVPGYGYWLRVRPSRCLATVMATATSRAMGT